jgi:hypothetical protein
MAIATYSVVGLNEGVVDGNDLDVGVLHSIAEDDTANAAESVDANFDNHLVCSLGPVSNCTKRVFGGEMNRVLRSQEQLGCDGDGKMKRLSMFGWEFKPSMPGDDAWMMRNYWSHIGPFSLFPQPPT